MTTPNSGEYLTPQQTAAYWLNNGGSSSAVVMMVAIAQAESSLDVTALSDADATGLWQILPVHATDAGMDPQQLYNPNVNAWFAVQLSNNGASVAPWDTAYRSIEAAGERYPLSYPEQGSPAYSDIAGVAAALGVAGGGSAGIPVDAGYQTPNGQLPGVDFTPQYARGQYPTDIPAPNQQAPSPFVGLPAAYYPVSNVQGWDEVVDYLTTQQQQLLQTDKQIVQTLQDVLGGQ